MKLTVVLLVILFGSILLSNYQLVLAAGNAATSEGELNQISPPASSYLGESLISPASPFYFLKVWREDFELFLTGSDNAMFYRQLEFARRRLREIKVLIKEQRPDLISSNLDRYRGNLQMVYDLENKLQSHQLEIAITLSEYQDTLHQAYGQISDPALKQKILQEVDKDSQYNQTILKNLNPEDKKLLLNLQVRQELICKFLVKEASVSDCH